MVVVPGEAGRDEQDHDGRHGDEAEADVEVQVPPCVAVQDGRRARLTTGLALKVMSWVDPYGMAGKRRVVAGKVWYFDSAGCA